MALKETGMKSKVIWQALAIALLCATGAQAAEPEKAKMVVRDYTDSVAPADQEAYEAGIKRYNQCLSQHGFKYGWRAWIHETGDTYTYSYVTDPLAWGNFDDMRATGKICDPSISKDVNPHLKGETSAFMEMLPALSYLPDQAMMKSEFIQVTFFKLKPNHAAFEAFRAAAQKIAAAAAKAHWSSHYSLAEVREGGQDAPDFIVVSPSNSWADLEKEDSPPMWTMVENVYGKEAAQAMRKALNDAIVDQSSHVDRYDVDLTYVPTKQ
jgi:hypothetical protein